MVLRINGYEAGNDTGWEKRSDIGTIHGYLGRSLWDIIRMDEVARVTLTAKALVALSNARAVWVAG